MREYEYVLEKLAFSARQRSNNVPSKERTFEDIQDERQRQDLLQIQSVQMYNDFMAESQLIARNRGVISKAVQSSRALGIAGYDQTYQYAVNALKRAIRNFDLDMYKNVKPVTHFTNSLNMDIDKLFKSLTSSTGVKMSVTLNDAKKTANIASSILEAQLGRKPTNDEIIGFANTEMKKGGSYLTNETLNRINHYSTQEFSGSAVIGQNGGGSGAEQLTLNDVANVNKNKIEDEYLQELEDEKIINAIREYTDDKQKRTFLMKMLGLGEFKNKPANSITEAAFGCGISYYMGEKEYAAFKKFAISKNII